MPSQTELRVGHEDPNKWLVSQVFLFPSARHCLRYASPIFIEVYTCREYPNHSVH